MREVVDCKRSAGLVYFAGATTIIDRNGRERLVVTVIEQPNE
jgi:hypothetical protein